MRIEHLAVHSRDIARLRDFYVTYFGGVSNDRYHSKSGMESFFVRFDGGARLELMVYPDLADGHDMAGCAGLAHLAFTVGSRETLDTLTARLRDDGYAVLSAPRVTGDGYYESCVTDPDGNRVELVAEGT